MYSCRSMGPLVVSALKLGATEPRRRLYPRVSYQIASLWTRFNPWCWNAVTYGVALSDSDIVRRMMGMFIQLELVWRGRSRMREDSWLGKRGGWTGGR